MVEISRIRWRMVVKFEQKWTALTREPFLSRRNSLSGGFAVVLALPPLFGIGKYTERILYVTYNDELLAIGYSLININS